MRVAVVGAGIQGVCIALELALRGVSVDLFEREENALTRASLRNEGKIHLGYVYANDKTFATAKVMIAGALCFGPLMRRWLGAAPPSVSSPFYYLVHRDSMLAPDELQAAYRHIDALIVQRSQLFGTDYFGYDAPVPVERLQSRSLRGEVADAEIAAIFRTVEIAVDPEALALQLRSRIVDEPRIHLCCRTSVVSVAVEPHCILLDCARASERETIPYDHVINASWEGRLAIDASSGIDLPPEWCFRAKYFLRLRAPRGAVDVPSSTIVLGPFGDVVRYANADLFLSWYPVARTALSRESAPPRWPDKAPEPQASELRRGISGALGRIFPGLDRLEAGALGSADVLGGAIYALGQTDITDPLSGLHQRWNIGPRSVGRYHSVDTGKYSLAPMFAKRIVDRILDGA